MTYRTLFAAAGLAAVGALSALSTAQEGGPGGAGDRAGTPPTATTRNDSAGVGKVRIRVVPDEPEAPKPPQPPQPSQPVQPRPGMGRGPGGPPPGMAAGPPAGAFGIPGEPMLIERRFPAGTRPTWEYDFAEAPSGADGLKKLLTEKGSEGWEYAGPYTGTEGKSVIVFKRTVIPQNRTFEFRIGRADDDTKPDAGTTDDVLKGAQEALRTQLKLAEVQKSQVKEQQERALQAARQATQRVKDSQRSPERIEPTAGGAGGGGSYGGMMMGGMSMGPQKIEPIKPITIRLDALDAKEAQSLIEAWSEVNGTQDRVRARAISASNSVVIFASDEQAEVLKKFIETLETQTLRTFRRSPTAP